MNNNTNKQPVPPAVVIIVVIIGIGLYLMFASGRNTNPNTGTQNQPTQAEPTPTGNPANTGEQANVKEFSIDAGSYFYTPNEIRVNQGDKVRITVNVVDMAHDFNIDELNVRTPVTAAGQTSAVEFTASRKGEFEYYCSVGDHRARGQVGTLIVE